MMSYDLKLIAGDFLYSDLPPDKLYLKLYFDGDFELSFIGYYFHFPDLYKAKGFVKFFNLFREHTGKPCCRRWAQKLIARVIFIENSIKEAEEKYDFKRVAEIRSGKLTCERLSF